MLQNKKWLQIIEQPLNKFEKRANTKKIWQTAILWRGAREIFITK